MDALRAWISAAAPGTQLPSTRSLVAEYHVSPLTVQKALQILTAQGLVETRPGVGAFVRAVRSARPADYSWQTAALRIPPTSTRVVATALRSAPHDVIAFHSGYPDRELLPERQVRVALARAARSEAAVTRPAVAGLPDLQSWFAQELRASTPASVNPPTPADVIVLPGTQSGLSSIFRALAGRGQSVVMESPTYWGAMLAASQAGVRIVPVPSGAEGPDPAHLDRAFQETGARLFYAQPNHANPTGAQWSPALREAVLDVVRAHGAFVVEDDWAHDLGITTTAVPLAVADDAGHVVYLRSLTKSVSPAIRVGAIIARGPAKDRILADRAAGSMYVSGLLQAAALDVVTSSGWQSHVRGVRQQLRDRRDLLISSLHEHAPLARVEKVPTGGLNLWVRLPDHTDLPRVIEDCESAGVLVAGGGEWFPAEPTAPYLRLGYGGPNPAAFPDGARVLGEVLREHEANGWTVMEGSGGLNPERAVRTGRGGR